MERKKKILIILLILVIALYLKIMNTYNKEIENTYNNFISWCEENNTSATKENYKYYIEEIRQMKRYLNRFKNKIKRSLKNMNKEELNFETNYANYIYKKGEYKIEELKPIYDSRKSFYGKAKVIYLDDDTILLQSYNTIVAHVYKGIYKSYGKYSQTTTRHQREFEEQFAN